MFNTDTLTNLRSTIIFAFSFLILSISCYNIALLRFVCKMVHHMEKPVLRFAKLSENATCPTKGSSAAAGFDLYSAYDYTIASKGYLYT